MDEVGETPPEVVAQNMDVAAKKDKSVTFDEVKEKAWQQFQETLNQWHGRIEDKIKEKASGINQHLNDLSVLYGEPVPDSIVVSLQYYPREGTQKGEPINNFVESGRLDEETADVLYWISNPSILPTDSPEDIERINEDSTDRALGSVLHETQHRSFQKKGFEQLVQTSEQNTEVKQVLDKLEGMRGDYLEVTNELVTTYLETFGKKKLQEAQEVGTTPTPLVVEVDKEKTGAVLEAVIKEDIEGRRDKGKGPGPYTDLRQRWEKTLGGLPEGYQTKEGDRNVTEKSSDRSYMGVQVYEVARQLDTGLAERYVEEGRQMDEEFIVELYKMVDLKLEDKAGGIEAGQKIQTPITEVKAIERNRNEMITTRDEIKEYVEPPLVDACERFWDLNVRTLSSSANSKDVGHEAYVIVDFNSLSEGNKQIAEESGKLLENYDGRPAVDIEIPVDETTSADEINKKASEIANRFQKQKATWIPSYSLQEMRQMYGIEPEDNEYGVDSFKEEGYYFDGEGKKFYLSEEHFQKTKDKVD